MLECIVPNPLGVVAVLSAFNFPVAVYGWLGILSPQKFGSEPHVGI
jgi:hypothetical protein